MASLEADDGIDEDLVAEEGEAGGERGLQEAWAQALKEAPNAFLSPHTQHTVQKTPVRPHLHTNTTTGDFYEESSVKIQMYSSSINISLPSERISSTPHLSELDTRLFKAAHLKPLFDQVKGKLLEDVVEEELQTSVRENSYEGGRKAPVKGEQPFGVQHGAHRVPQVMQSLGEPEQPRSTRTAAEQEYGLSKKHGAPPQTEYNEWPARDPSTFPVGAAMKPARSATALNRDKERDSTSESNQ
ncbi:hypothetical protein DNTS_020605 [Danionella cerebrum]|uniref:Uncharacterized protein n=1 Tax=Danionella cerebrum TaxID=2873325 RepID=A0A553R560_9TELE|nr:hypothetical protein DNTS_020605 [Danionella translucida]